MKNCPKCDTVKPIEQFNRDRKRPDGRAGHCKECAANARARLKQEKRLKVQKILESSGCVDCGHGDWRVLEFDHLPEFDKVQNVGRMIAENKSWTVIQQEIQKCEIVCANCHKLRTYDRLDNCWRA